MELKFSEAIRLGALNKPQGKGLVSGDPKNDATCAWGAALDAAGVVGTPVFCNEPVYGGIRDAMIPAGWRTVLQVPLEWTPVTRRAVLCPGGGADCAKVDLLGSIVTHLNDDHGWTRNQIADWVDLQERAVAGAVPVLHKIESGK